MSHRPLRLPGPHHMLESAMLEQSGEDRPRGSDGSSSGAPWFRMHSRQQPNTIDPSTDLQFDLGPPGMPVILAQARGLGLSPPLSHSGFGQGPPIENQGGSRTGPDGGRDVPSNFSSLPAAAQLAMNEAIAQMEISPASSDIGTSAPPLTSAQERYNLPHPAMVIDDYSPTWDQNGPGRNYQTGFT
jgi:hypothetical protein